MSEPCGDGEIVPVGVIVDEVVTVVLTVSEGVGDGEPDVETVAVTDGDPLGVAVKELAGEALALPLGDGEDEGDLLPVLVIAPLGLTLIDAVAEIVTLEEAVGLGLGEGDWLVVPEIVTDGDPLGVAV